MPWKLPVPHGGQGGGEDADRVGEEAGRGHGAEAQGAGVALHQDVRVDRRQGQGDGGPGMESEERLLY